ncbi:MAG: MFS transporter [Candidatus Kapaibacterium sp.]
MPNYFQKILRNAVGRFRELSRALSGKEEAKLWQRNLAILSLGQFITMVGMSSVVPFLPLYIRELGVTDLESAKLWSGFIFAGPFFLSMFAVPVWGSLGDKYGRKIMIIRALLGLSVMVFMMSLAQTPLQLLILRVIQGGVSGFIAAALSFTTANTPREKSGFAIGILQSSSSAGIITGPLIGGVVSDLYGIRPVFYLVSALCLLSAILTIVMVKEEKIISKEAKGVIDNLKFVLKSPILSVLMVMIVLSQGGINFTNPIFPFLVEDLGAPDEYLKTLTGALVGIVGIFSIVMAPFWGRRNDRKNFRKTMAVAASVSGLSLMAHVFVTDYVWLFPLRAVTGLFVAGVIPTLYSALSKRSPSENQGGIMGLASSATIFGSFSAYITCGLIASAWGLDSAFIVSGALLILSAIFSFYRQKK